MEKKLYHPEKDEFYWNGIKAMREKFIQNCYDFKQFVIDHQRGCPAGLSRMSETEQEHIAFGLGALVHSYLNPDHEHGSFITNLRMGKLYSAMKCADDVNMQYFYLYMDFIYNETPIHVHPPILNMI